MSKDAALSMLSGQPVTQTNPSLITGDMPKGELSPPPVIPSKEQIDSDRFAKIAAKEAKLVKERELLKLEQAKTLEERTKAETIAKAYNDFEMLKKTDPVAAFKQLGFTETDFANWLAEGKVEPTTAEIAQQAVKTELEKFHEEQKQQAMKVQEQRDNIAIKNFRGSITSEIAKDPDKYEYCNHYGPIAEEIVYETILGIIKEEPDIAPNDAMREAMDLVEEFYEKEDEEMSKLKKRQPRLNTPEAKPEPTRQTAVRSRTLADQVVQKKIPTLTNKATATAASQVPKGKETPQQKRERLENWLRDGKPQ